MPCERYEVRLKGMNSVRIVKDTIVILQGDDVKI
jgi:hypothetical protein